MTQTLIAQLVERFNQEDISYCHWKSNIDLAETMGGKLDVDLLVANQSLAKATEILMRLGFKAAIPRWGNGLSGVFHYYGYDPMQDDLVHLHMFTRVLTGESFLKSHLFPFEEMLLNNTYSIDGLKVASKETELVLFILRSFIKFGSLLDLIRLMRGRNKLTDEAHWLQTGSHMELVISYLENYCPVIPKELFGECLETILKRGGYLKLLRLSFIVRRRLRPYRKYSFGSSLMGYFQVMLGMLEKKLRNQKGSKILSAGGAVISIVGADATGKSTLVAETNRWLRKNFVVTTVHAGKPPSSITTLPVNMALAANKCLMGKSKRTRNDEDKVPSSNLSTNKENRLGINSLVYAVRAIALAWDRRALLLKVRRAVAHGEIVISDRYPTNSMGMMDSPRLNENLKQKGFIGLMYGWLARMEMELYRHIPPPHIVLRLNVSFDVAKKRNSSREIVDDEVYLQNRHQQAKEWYVTGTRSVQDVNTDLSLAETLLIVKQAIWMSL